MAMPRAKKAFATNYAPSDAAAASSLGARDRSTHWMETGRVVSGRTWTEARKCLDQSTQRIMHVCRSAGGSMGDIETELGWLIGALRGGGFAAPLLPGERGHLARQIAIWCARRDRESASRLVRQALALLIAGSDGPSADR